MHFSARLCALSIRSPKLFKIATSKNRTVRAELQNDIWIQSVARLSNPAQIAEFIDLANIIHGTHHYVFALALPPAPETASHLCKECPFMVATIDAWSEDHIGPLPTPRAMHEYIDSSWCALTSNTTS